MCEHARRRLKLNFMQYPAIHTNGVEAFLYCQIEGAVSDDTVTLARQQSTQLFF